MPPFKVLANFKYKLFFSRSILVFEYVEVPFEFLVQSMTPTIVGMMNLRHMCDHTILTNGKLLASGQSYMSHCSHIMEHGNVDT
jgi:hypothetical protein